MDGWNKPFWLTVASTLVASALPLAAFVRETYSQDRELAVTRADQEFKFRSAYLDRAIDPARPPALRQSVLRFLVQTTDDDRLRRWAEDELKMVTVEVDQLKAEIAKLREALGEEERRMARAVAALDQEREARDRDAKTIASAQAEIEALRRSTHRLQSRFEDVSRSLLFGADWLRIPGKEAPHGGSVAGATAEARP